MQSPKNKIWILKQKIPFYLQTKKKKNTLNNSEANEEILIKLQISRTIQSTPHQNLRNATKMITWDAFKFISTQIEE